MLRMCVYIQQEDYAEESAGEAAEETAEGAADEQKMATDENISNASYVKRAREYYG